MGQGVDAVDDVPPSSTTGLRHVSSSSWSRIAAALPSLRLPSSKKASAATTMYSISFFPWRMEAFAYYSSPWAAAAWVPDTASMRCQVCLAAFTLTRRRHHCRLCGHLVCNDCSLPRTFLPFAPGARSQHHLVRDGQPQRTCNACASTLESMAAQHDARVHKITVASASHASATLGKPRCPRANVGGRIGDVRDGPTDTTQRFAMRPTEEMEEVMTARAVSRSKSVSKQFVMSSPWLELWRQYIQSDPGSTRHLPSSDGNQTKRSLPRPGPVANYSLLDFVNGSLVPKDNLEQSGLESASGAFHVVSEDVWLTFLRLYGGGPSIEVASSSKETSTTASEVTGGQLVSSSAQSSGRWVISERSASVATEIGELSAPRRVGFVSYRKKTELGVSKELEVRASRGSLGASFDSRNVRASHGRKSDRDLVKRWTLARAFSFRQSSRSSSSETFHTPDDHGSRACSRTRIDSQTFKASVTWGAEALGRIRERRALTGAPRLVEEADAPYSRSTIAVISAFTQAATEARRRSAMSLSRHPSSQLIGPPSSASAA